MQIYMGNSFKKVHFARKNGCFVYSVIMFIQNLLQRYAFFCEHTRKTKKIFIFFKNKRNICTCQNFSVPLHKT